MGWHARATPLSRRIRVSSHIDASALFNCSSDTRSDDILAPGSNMFFRFRSFPGRILGILRDSGRAWARCLAYTTTRITGYLVLHHPPGTKKSRIDGEEGEERRGIDPRRKGSRRHGAAIFSSSGDITGISLVIKSHRAVWLELMVKWSICPGGKKSSAVKWPRHSICTWWHVAAQRVSFATLRTTAVLLFQALRVFSDL